MDCFPQIRWASPPSTLSPHFFPHRSPAPHVPLFRAAVLLAVPPCFPFSLFPASAVALPPGNFLDNFSPHSLMGQSLGHQKINVRDQLVQPQVPQMGKQGLAPGHPVRQAQRGWSCVCPSLLLASAPALLPRVCLHALPPDVGLPEPHPPWTAQLSPDSSCLDLSIPRCLAGHDLPPFRTLDLGQLDTSLLAFSSRQLGLGGLGAGSSVHGLG